MTLRQSLWARTAEASAGVLRERLARDLLDLPLAETTRAPRALSADLIELALEISSGRISPVRTAENTLDSAIIAAALAGVPVADIQDALIAGNPALDVNAAAHRIALAERDFQRDEPLR